MEISFFKFLKIHNFINRFSFFVKDNSLKHEFCHNLLTLSSAKHKNRYSYNKSGRGLGLSSSKKEKKHHKSTHLQSSEAI